MSTLDGREQVAPLTEILRSAGVNIGRAPLQGPALATILFVTAVDVFQALFALAELDSASSGRRVLLADARDGRTLSAKEGPLRPATSIRRDGSGTSSA